MSRSMLLASTVTIALLETSAVGAGALLPAVSIKSEPTHRILFPHLQASLLYDQSDNDNGTGIVAQNFESSFDIYDCEGADDFKVPAGKVWRIKEIYVDGTYFDGSGSARSFNVTFYKNNEGKVGKAVKRCSEASYYYDTPFDFGYEHIQCKATLKKGRYFVAIQANMDFSQGGEWGWLTNNTVRGIASLWRNPQDGFQTGCTEFGTTTDCIAGEEGGDYGFALYGKQSSSL